MIKVACMNAVRIPGTSEIFTDIWYRCGWIGEVSNLDDECPRCLNKGRLAPVVEVPPIEEVESE